MIEAKKITKKSLRNTEFRSRIINIARVTKVTTGGRRMSISVLVVIGDENGVFGYGLGNANETKDAEQKAFRVAQNNLFSVPLKKFVGDAGGKRVTVGHEVNGKFGSSRVSILSAKPGTGVIAGPVVRSILESLGITDVVAKSRGSSNPHNVLKAAVDALMKLRSQKYYKYLQQVNDIENEE